MSECTFLRKFREATGFSPTDYLLRSRIRRAEELLARRKLSITEVAARCGFEDSNYFSRQFRRVTGVSPRAHRRSG
jgi:AraC-like DNA-binding protein